MQQGSQVPTHYSVAVDKGSLQGKPDKVEGTRYSVEGTVYSVGLSGAVDDRWARAFHIVQLDSTGFTRFHLDAAAKTVSFQVRAADGAARVMLLIERLDHLVEEVNRNASLWGRSDT